MSCSMSCSMARRMAELRWCQDEAHLLATAMGANGNGRRRNYFRMEIGISKAGKMLRLSIFIPNDANHKDVGKKFPYVAETVLVHDGHTIYQNDLEELGYPADVVENVGYMDVERFYSDTRASSPDHVAKLKAELHRLKTLLLSDADAEAKADAEAEADANVGADAGADADAEAKADADVGSEEATSVVKQPCIQERITVLEMAIYGESSEEKTVIQRLEKLKRGLLTTESDKKGSVVNILSTLENIVGV